MPRRNYIQKTGKRVEGVTTHLGRVLAKPALQWWAYKRGLGNHERFLEILAPMVSNSKSKLAKQVGGLITSFQPEGLYESRDKAGEAGTLAHSMIETHIHGGKTAIVGYPEDVLEKAESCFRTFKTFEATSDIKYLASEVELTSEKHPFGGTIDHVILTTITPPDYVEILDVKTGKDIYTEALFQVAGYGVLWEEKNDTKVFGYHIIRLGTEGEFTHKYFPASALSVYTRIGLKVINISHEIKEAGIKL